MLRPKFSPLALLLVFGLIALACDLLAATARKPTVIIISPPSGSQFREGEDVVLQSTSTDSTGIVRVELVVDGATARTDSAPSPQGQRSFALIQKWKAIQGDHTITVRAYTAAGAVSDPAAISVSVSPAVVAAPPTPPSHQPWLHLRHRCRPISQKSRWNHHRRDQLRQPLRPLRLRNLSQGAR